MKKNDIIGCEGGVEQYVKGIVSSPTKFSYVSHLAHSFLMSLHIMSYECLFELHFS